MGMIHSIAKWFVGNNCSEYETNNGNLKKLRELTEKLSEPCYEQCNLEHKYRNLVHSSTEVIMLTKPDGTIAHISSNCFGLLGHNAGSLIGTIPWIIHQDDSDRVKTHFNNALNGKSGNDVVYDIITKANEIKSIVHSWTPLFVNGQLYLIASIVREHKK